MTKVFFDTEFTGLHQDTTLISIGLVASNGKQFYAELTDYDPLQVDDWVEENVMKHLLFTDDDQLFKVISDYTFVKGDSEDVQKHLADWFSQFNKVELWSDCLHYDVVLLHDLFEGAFGMPDNVYYIPFDICTLFHQMGIDPDIRREAFIDEPVKGVKHNALYDALVIEACYQKLQRNQEAYLKQKYLG